MIDTCWYNRFSPTNEACVNPGVWKNPEWLANINGFNAAVRWCDDHKHDDDIPINTPCIDEIAHLKGE